jgi:hypothetical protein
MNPFSKDNPFKIRNKFLFSEKKRNRKYKDGRDGEMNKFNVFA